MTIIVTCRVECRDCGWKPRRRYHKVVSYNNFGDGSMEPASSRYSLPEICKKCGSPELNIEDDRIAADARPTGDQVSEETERLEGSIPSFLRRISD